MAEVYIGIGSNLGDREDYIRKSIGLMNDFGIAVIRLSSIIETEPYGYTDQPPFLNCVAHVETFYSPLHLLNALQLIEKTLGRKRSIRWGPRTIDLDILLYNSVVIDTPRLKIPHPDMVNRYFVLKPLSEIAPDLVNPVLGKTMTELLNGIKT